MRLHTTLTLLSTLGFSQLALADAPPEFSKTRWTLASYHCAHGCSPSNTQFLDSKLGSTIDLGPEGRLQVGHGEVCSGNKTIVFDRQVPGNLLKTLNQKTPQAQALAVKNSQIHPRKVLVTAKVNCTDASGKLNSVMFVSVTPNRLVAYDRKEQTFLVYE